MAQTTHNSLARMANRGSRHHWNLPSALYNRSLGCLYGEGTREDDQKAFLLNLQAAESGLHDAVLAMGWFYLNGVGVERDDEQAKSWYRKSARQGEPRAMFSLGQMAFNRRDYANAMVWFRRAADKGHALSLFWIGKLFWRGDGVPVDKKQAMALFQKASGEKVPVARLFQKASNEKVLVASRVLRFLSRTKS